MTSSQNVEIPSGEFRKAMRELAGAISVITVVNGDERTGFVATSVSSFSADPPRLILCIDRSSSSRHVLSQSGAFGVNFLRDSDAPVANRFAGFGGIKGNDRYAGATWVRTSNGVLLLDTALASLECQVEETLDRYDHSIILSRVESIRVQDGDAPLLWFKAGYHRLGEAL